MAGILTKPTKPTRQDFENWKGWAQQNPQEAYGMSMQQNFNQMQNMQAPQQMPMPMEQPQMPFNPYLQNRPGDMWQAPPRNNVFNAHYGRNKYLDSLPEDQRMMAMQRGNMSQPPGDIMNMPAKQLTFPTEGRGITGEPPRKQSNGMVRLSPGIYRNYEGKTVRR